MKTLAVINGGGCRQIECAAGILTAMDEAGIQINEYRGSSAGAAVAALHASGLSGSDLQELIRQTPVEKLFQLCRWCQVKRMFGFTVDHLFDASGMYDILKENMIERASEIVRVAVTRLRDYKSFMINATPATVMASAAIPEVFKPVMIGSEFFVDGGVKNMIPTPKITEISNYDHIYLLLCNDDLDEKIPKNLVGRALRAFSNTMDRETTQIYEEGWGELSNVTIIQPPPYKSSLLNWSENHGLIGHAYNYAKLILQKERAL